MNLKKWAMLLLTVFSATALILDAVLDIAASSSNGFSFIAILSFYSSNLVILLKNEPNKKKDNKNEN